MPSPTATRPQGYNVLLIVVDQERYFDKYPFPVPGRERLLRTGTSFTNHQNCANVCTPSRSVLYTGWHMPKTQLFDNFGLPWMTNSLDPALGTLGSLMREAGYYSAYKGKWHLSQELDAVVRNKGEVDLGLQPTPEMHKVMETYGFSDYHGIGDVIGWSQGGYLYDGVTAGQTVNWLRGAGQSLNQQGKNWFLAVNLVNPHDVMFIDTDEPDEKVQWQGRVNAGGVSMNPAQPPANAIYRESWDATLPDSRHQPFDEPGRPKAHLEYQNARAALVGQFPDEDRRWRKLQDYYFNCIRDCDQHVEALLAEMDRLDLTQSTVVIFTSDHGELGGAHSMHGKGSSVYREQIQVPFIVVHPAHSGGRRCGALTNHLDIAPTLLGLTGLPDSEQKRLLGDRKGHNLTPLLDAPEEAGTHAVRQASLYCFGMILYTDAAYIAKVQEIQVDPTLSEQSKARAVSALQPDFSKRSGIRSMFNGRYKFARYFSLRQHHLPSDRAELFAYNDVELFDLENDPHEMTNLALGADALDPTSEMARLIDDLNTQLNALISDEIGTDDGSYLPLSGFAGWDLRLAVE